jgi:peptide/nickel transport system permease protein
LFGVPISVAIAMLMLMVMVGSALFAPALTPYDPRDAALKERMLPPVWVERGSEKHLLGTDGLGRDVFARLIYGARISLSVAALVIIFGGGVGALIGITAGYFGGMVDTVLMRIVDIMMSIPYILVAIVLAVALGPSFINIVVVIAVLLWPNIARQIRGDALAIRRQDYAVYAEMIGLPRWRIMLQHILPNVTPSLVVVATLETGGAILTESTLGFLGVGIPPPEPSWGLMVSEGAGLIATGWWIALFPGLAIMLTVWIFNTIGDWLRDATAPSSAPTSPMIVSVTSTPVPAARSSGSIDATSPRRATASTTKA